METTVPSNWPKDGYSGPPRRYTMREIAIRAYGLAEVGSHYIEAAAYMHSKTTFPEINPVTER